MPEDIETCERNQVATLWIIKGFDRHNQIQVFPPIQVNVRWNQKRSDTLDALGSTIALDAEAVVDRRVPIDSLMALSKLTDWIGTGTGTGTSLGTFPEIHQVKTIDEAKDMKGINVRRTVGLMRFMGTLPIW
jgi:hypothetical protein